MKKQILSILILALAIVLFNSCEKEENTSNAVVAIDPDAPKASYEDPALDEPLKELELPVSKESTDPVLEDFSIINTGDNTDLIQSRDYYVNIGYYTGTNLWCNSYVAGSLWNKINKISNTTYSGMGFSADLNGGDDIYVLTITQRSNVSINLSNTTQNLAMSLFRGTRRCISNSTIGLRCELNLINRVAGTSSTSLYGDFIGPVTLEPGEYILVVDGQAGYPSNFNLRVNCSPVYPPCVAGTSTLLYDDFENYNLGALEPQSAHWTKYFPTSPNYAEIWQNGGKYMTVQYKSGTTGTTQTAPMLQLGTRTTGNYVLNMKMWIYKNRSALIGTVKNYTGNTSTNQIGAYLKFEAGANGSSTGTGTITTEGCDDNCRRFSFPHDQWMDVQLRINLEGTIAYTYLYINGTFKGYWRSDATRRVSVGEKRIEGLTFFSTYSNTQYFINNVCFARYN